MTQASLLKALQDGPLTSHQVAEETGMSQATVISTARKLKEKGLLTIGKVKSGKFWVAEYTLIGEVPKETQTVFHGIQTVGIFTPQEYRTMQAQLKKLYRNHDFSKDITNHQNI